ncbi:cytochrome C oxidase assembly protein [Catenovulum agarivorans DS-2]|uniref:Cytochrome c oxidase assembly protein CtaG n=1 Tax=Catenovulum agarivorans DS-2 TaxID=1328313 RepID=W7QKU0_9ALTE|nr:cytochrome c oxidase assembly protein [Catenovulum agarivorans]EWH08693.1 cytochrome C oxidase assembly protein [Catenovulum agarivorans DS-2]
MSQRSVSATQQQANTRLVKRLLLATAIMFGFGFALVPLYDVFCDITGLNGRVYQKDTQQTQAAQNLVAPLTEAEQDNIDVTRSIKLEMMTISQAGGAILFEPIDKTLRIHPGQMAEARFRITNVSKDAKYVQAIPSISPGQAGLYLHKTACFCFEQQHIEANQQNEFVMQFYLDTDLPEDILQMTLAYTLY